MSKNNNSFREFIGMSILFLILILHISSNASASITNGDFDTGDHTGWVLSDGDIFDLSSGRGGIYIGTDPHAYLYQNFSVGDATTISFETWGIQSAGASWVSLHDFDTGDEFYRIYTTNRPSPYYFNESVDISGRENLRILVGNGYSTGGIASYIDNVTINDIPPPEDSFINFTPNVNITDIKPVLCDYNMHPDDLNYYYDNDTKRVGNTVEIMNGWTSYTCPELPTLWISEGFTDSNESGSHTLEYCDSYNATYDIELRASWYELEGGSWLWHHGRDGLLLANDTIVWTFNYTYPDPDPEPDPDPYDPPDPYNPPEIPPPPMPNYWNMTIPEKYQNVTWLTNYTTYFNEMGGTINTTLYSVSGWVISPLMSLNNTVYSLRYYMANTHNMVDGLSHLHMIVNYGWSVVPTEIKVIFTGSAAIGVCIFLFKLRT